MKSNERGLDKFFQELSTYVPITLKLTALILHTKYIYGIQYDESAHWIINRPYNDLIVSCSWFMIKSGEIS